MTDSIPDRRVTGEQSEVCVKNNGKAFSVSVKTIRNILGIVVVVGGGFAAYYKLQPRAIAKEEHRLIAKEAKDRRVDIRKEAKEERLLMKDEIITIINRQHDQTREDFADLRKELRAIIREVRHNHGGGP